MIFAAPLALLCLLALPAILFLIRLTPPPPRRIEFAPIRLLTALDTAQRAPERTPLWLLLLRLLAAALIIVGLAGPSWHQPPALPGNGPVLLVIDNGWASAADWPQRREAALNIAAAAGAQHRGVALLATAPLPSGAAPGIQGVMTAAAARRIITALTPQPWPTDRLAVTAALRDAPATSRIYIADGIMDGPGFNAFLNTLAPNRILAAATPPALLLPSTIAADGDLVAHALNVPPHQAVIFRDASGASLAAAPLAADGSAEAQLPPALSARIAAITLAGPATAAGTQLLDGTSHDILAGLAAGSPDAETPFLGSLYFIRRALPAGTTTLTGGLRQLIAAHANLIILADQKLAPPDQQAARAFIATGGIVVRFAGPLTAADPDGLAPDPLLPGDRRLGGALSWTSPEPIAPFPPESPLAGLPVDSGVTISRQVVTDPTTMTAGTVWASLRDGTPLILGTRIGKGYLVTFLTTANADWSNLALSGLFPALLSRIVDISQGADPPPGLMLALQNEMSAFGTLSPAAINLSLSAGALTTSMVSPAHPPGIYGNNGITRALNIGGHVPPPALATLPGSVGLSSQPAPRDLGPDLLAAAMLLLTIDLLLSLALRGLLRRPGLALVALLLIPALAQAQTAALQPTLGYILTGDPATDQRTGDALTFLSEDVSTQTSAQLGNPVALHPAVDDLALYAMIYWPVLPNAEAPAPAVCDALDSYMRHGGLLVMDSTGSDADAPGSGAGFAPGTSAAFARITACLALPPLVPLTTSDALAHCFYILHDFPGRFAGAPVLIASAAGRDADDVTPIVITQNDFAGAWARDASGTPEQTPLPDGSFDPAAQRVAADRFGTNLVIYALTGSYKADQSHVPALLDKLGP
jgi:hypothetical protein